jgi:hypothetical protein
MMHNMHPACESGAAIQHSHNVTPFLYHFAWLSLPKSIIQNDILISNLLKANIFAENVYWFLNT